MRASRRQILLALLSPILAKAGFANMLLVPPPSAPPAGVETVWTDIGAYQNTTAMTAWTDTGGMTTL